MGHGGAVCVWNWNRKVSGVIIYLFYFAVFGPDFQFSIGPIRHYNPSEE